MTTPDTQASVPTLNGSVSLDHALRQIRKCIDGSQPIDTIGARMALDHVITNVSLYGDVNANLKAAVETLLDLIRAHNPRQTSLGNCIAWPLSVDAALKEAIPASSDLRTALHDTGELALELMERFARVDRKLIELDGRDPSLEQEAGEMTRMRSRISRNRALLNSPSTATAVTR